ncbi:MAG: hypothetical protein BA874_11900 [Desulfuromonadales bacterium C00003068]|jgi:small-conductance mechanosensitive channel|nr:MAG: hypothetical protein BA874_11900 [Desulfuromonadales bacterium C00003068]
MRNVCCFILLIWTFLALTTIPLCADESIPITNTIVNGDSAVITAPAFPGVSEVIALRATLGNDISTTKTQLTDLADHRQISDNLEKILARQTVLDERLKELGDPASWSFERLLERKNTLNSQITNLSTIFDDISAYLTLIEDLRSQWHQRQTFWREWKTFLATNQAEFSAEEFDSSVRQCDELLNIINETGNILISVQQQVLNVQDTNQSSLRLVNNALNILRGQIFKKTARSLFSLEFYQQFTPETAQQFLDNLDLVQWRSGYIYINDFWWVTVLQLSVALALGVSLRRRRSEKNEASQWNVLFRHPWATGLFVTFTTLSPIYKAPPLSWTFYLLVISVLSASILVADTVPARRHALVVWLLATTYLVSMLFQVIGLPLPLYRLYMIFLSLAGIPLLIRIYSLCHKNRDAWQLIVSLRIGMVLLLVSLTAQLGGYSTLSSRLIDSSIKTVFLLLMISMVMRLARGGIDFIVTHPWIVRWQFFRIFGQRLGIRINNILKGVLYVYGILYMGQIWAGSDSVTTTWLTLKGLGFSIGEIQLTLDTLLMVVVVMYLAYTLSWLLRSLFDVEVIGPRYIDSGVRDSIKTLLHYAIISCGVLFTLGVAGVGMKNFTVIIGALGIGIGFGLQNIVNNFLSGLILLFERPVKLGDRIVLDGEWAIVRKIGMRSTVVEMYSKAEIIVPNSQLISEKVTNLSLSNSQSRLVIDIGTAYGEDMEQILEILREEAEAHPSVLSYPKPSPLFVNFGDSSLDFQLRVWLANYDQSVEVKSELCVALYKRFAAEGIEIPFPQRDLHIRSLEPTLWSQLSSLQSVTSATEAHNNSKNHHDGTPKGIG